MDSELILPFCKLLSWFCGLQWISFHFSTMPKLTQFWSSSDFTFFITNFLFRVQGLFLYPLLNFGCILYSHNIHYPKVSLVYLHIPGCRQMCELQEASGCVFWNFCKVHDDALWLQAQEKVKINNNSWEQEYDYLCKSYSAGEWQINKIFS